MNKLIYKDVRDKPIEKLTGLNLFVGMKKNCWEFKGCAQERRGWNNSHVTCPVPEMTTSNGINGGKNAGRICWLVSHTMCKGEADTTFEEMIKICGECDFYKLVKEEEGEELVLSLDMLREAYEKNRTGESNQKSRKHR